jgi:hypothetical protein
MDAEEVIFDALLRYLEREGPIKRQLRLGVLKKAVIDEIGAMGIDPEYIPDDDGGGTSVAEMSNVAFKHWFSEYGKRLYRYHNWRPVIETPYQDGNLYIRIVKRGTRFR